MVLTWKLHFLTFVHQVNLGANLDLPLRGGATVLHVAAEHGNTGLVTELANLGAKLNVKSSKGATPLALATTNGFIGTPPPIFSFLFFLFSFLFIHLFVFGLFLFLVCVASSSPALTNIFIGTVKALLELGASVNETSADGATVLHFATQNDFFEIVQELVKHGAELHASTPGGMTPILCTESADMVSTLVKLGANVNDQTKDGMSVSPLTL